MKDAEDEAFDELAKRQGDWGGGFKAKQAMAADKLQEPVSFPCCGYTDANAVRWNQFNGVVQCHMCGQAYTVAQPAQEPTMNDRQRLEAIVSVINKYLPPDGMHIMDAMSEIIRLVDPLPPPQPAQEPFGWYSAQVDEFMTHKIRKEHERLNSYTHINGKFDLALYSAPQRPWVGLTQKEVQEIHDTYRKRMGPQEFARAVEQLLKEKNNGT